MEIPADAGTGDIFEGSSASWWEGGNPVKIGDTIDPDKIDAPLDRMNRRSSGRRSQTRTETKRGRYIQARPANGELTDIAFDATIRADAPFQKERRSPDEQLAFSIRKQDLQRKIRVKQTANLILFVVDASWSMAVAERMSAAKGAVLSLLTDAYQHRDKVGMIVFQKDRAQLILPPTNSVELARRSLADIPIGGKTPLSAGLSMAYEVIKREELAHPDIQSLMILLTDGVGNVSISRMPPQKEAYKIAEKFTRDKIPSVVINMEHKEFDKGLAKEVAEHLNASYYSLSDLQAEKLLQTVKGEIGY
ncbi:MAG: VWA domain-containing protein [Anaerolineales bacterium]|nr:VWA domain-containing protein [Anaerolineales bacterium]